MMRSIRPFAFVLLAAAACGSPQPRPAAQRGTASPGPDASWHCFARDPRQPELPQGNVTHARHRLFDGRLEVETAHTQLDRAGATRLAFRPTGDHLEASLGGVSVSATLLAPDGSHWKLWYDDPRSGLRFTEETRDDGGGETVISTDPSEHGPVTTTVHFVPVACSIVETELAKYPSP